MALFSIALGISLTIAALKLQLDRNRKKRDRRNAQIAREQRTESKVYKKLRSKKDEEKKLIKRKNRLKKTATEYTRNANKEEKTRDDRENVRNNYRDVINPALRNVKDDLTGEYEDLEYTFDASDVKGKMLLSSIFLGNEEMDNDILNIQDKSQKLHSLIQTQNNHLDKTIDTVGVDVEEQQLTTERDTLYADHIKLEYILANNALWYFYYMLLAGLIYMYNRKNTMKNPSNVMLLIVLILFPYWMVILEIVMDIIVNLKEYVKTVTNAIADIPIRIETSFESLF